MLNGQSFRPAGLSASGAWQKISPRQRSAASGIQLLVLHLNSGLELSKHDWACLGVNGCWFPLQAEVSKLTEKLRDAEEQVLFPHPAVCDTLRV